MDVFGSVFTYYVVYCLGRDAAAVSGWPCIAAFASVPGAYGFMLLLNRLNISPSAALRIAYGCIFFVLAFLFAVYYHGNPGPCSAVLGGLYSAWRGACRVVCTSRGTSTALFLTSTRWSPTAPGGDFCRRHGDLRVTSRWRSILIGVVICRSPVQQKRRQRCAADRPCTPLSA